LRGFRPFTPDDSGDLTIAKIEKNWIPGNFFG